MIKDAIEWLITNGFLKRDENQRSKYQYIA
jgi:hypothetical protein